MKALIVDDEPKAAKYLENLIKQHCPSIITTLIYQRPAEALMHLKKEKVDVIFLDIEMPEMSGFELIEIHGVKNMPPIIFTTAYNSYATQAFKVQAIDYLLKPIDPEELTQAINRLEPLEAKQQEEKITDFLKNRPLEEIEHLVLVEGQQYHFAQPENLIRAQGSGSYTTFFLTDGRKIMTSKNLKSYRGLLQFWGFIRSHQSHLVNRQFIETLDKTDGGALVLKDGSRIPISTRLKNDVFRQLSLK